MKIEAGKIYIARNGSKVGPLTKIHDYWSADRFENENPGHYNENGMSAFSGDIVHGRNSEREKFDLIAEWRDGPVVTETVTVIKPGVYGRLRIGNEIKGHDTDRTVTVSFTARNGVGAQCENFMTKSEILDMIKTLTEIAEAM